MHQHSSEANHHHDKPGDSIAVHGLGVLASAGIVVRIRLTNCRDFVTI
jgi:hypothetical protein